MMITILTPTYNRAHCLGDLYRSLMEQTCRDFEWLVVDDGSSDDTEALVDSWRKEENGFDLRYLKKENGGKHTALNAGVPEARGEAVFIVDSDDMLTPDAVERVVEAFRTLPEEGFAGVGFQRAWPSGQPIGSTFQGETLDATSLERDRHGITGDKAEVFWRKVLLAHPFPVFGGERFLPEAVVWNRIARDGLKIRWINRPIYICEYRQDGLSINAVQERNPRGYMLLERELLKTQGLSFKARFKAAGIYAYYAAREGTSPWSAAREAGVSPVMMFAGRMAYAAGKRLNGMIKSKRLHVRH